MKAYAETSVDIRARFFFIKITRNAFCVEFVGKNFFFISAQLISLQCVIHLSKGEGGRTGGIRQQINPNP